MPELSCVIHVHSTYSDGTATLPELLEAAREAGVDALLLTDHDTLAARRDGWEGDHDGVFLLVGVEVSPKHGHYLAFGVEEPIAHRRLSAAGDRRRGSSGRRSGVRRPSIFARRTRSRRRSREGSCCRTAGAPSRTRADWTGSSCGAFSRTRRRRGARRRRLCDGCGTRKRRSRPVHRRITSRSGTCSARRRVPAIGGLDDHRQRGVRLRGRVCSPVPHWRTFNLLADPTGLRPPPDRRGGGGPQDDHPRAARGRRMAPLPDRGARGRLPLLGRTGRRLEARDGR